MPSKDEDKPISGLRRHWCRGELFGQFLYRDGTESRSFSLKRGSPERSRWWRLFYGGQASDRVK